MKPFYKVLSLILTLLIAMQSLQISIFANYAESLEILNGSNYEDFVFTDDAGCNDGGFANAASAFSNNTPAFAHLLEEPEPTDTVTLIKNLLDIDETAALQMITNFGDAESALEEARKFAELKRMYYILDYKSVKDFLTSLVVNGYGAERVAMSYIVADILNEDINGLMGNKCCEELFDDEFKNLLANKYYLCPDFIDDYTSEHQISYEAMYYLIENLVSNQFPYVSEVSSYSQTDDEENYPIAPYQYDKNVKEYVSPATGDFIYRIDLATVLGIREMDIELSLKYESAMNMTLS